MKKIAIVSILMYVTGNIYSQNIGQAVDGGRWCDTLFWTSTEYPVRLMNNVAELQEMLTEQLTLYPEDLEKSGKLTYRFTIMCSGIKIDSHLESHDGLQPGGLSMRILKILDDICTWSPAIQGEEPVNSYYNLSIDFKKGKISVIPQNKYEK